MPASTKFILKAYRGHKAVECVLARWSDSKYYRVMVKRYDAKRANPFCVVFEDGIESWLSREDIHLQLDPDHFDVSQIVCCQCEKDDEDESNVILICDTCEQGYHVNCHKPLVPEDTIGDSDTEWACSTCTLIDTQPYAASSTKSKELKPSVKSTVETTLAPETDNPKAATAGSKVSKERLIEKVVAKRVPSRKMAKEESSTDDNGTEDEMASEEDSGDLRPTTKESKETMPVEVAAEEVVLAAPSIVREREAPVTSTPAKPPAKGKSSQETPAEDALMNEIMVSSSGKAPVTDKFVKMIKGISKVNGTSKVPTTTASKLSINDKRTTNKVSRKVRTTSKPSSPLAAAY